MGFIDGARVMFGGHRALSAGLVVFLALAFAGGAWVGRPLASFAKASLSSFLDRPKDIVTINDSDGNGQQLARFYPAKEVAPLVVDLHQWSADQRGSFGDDFPLSEAVKANGWNYVRPALTGPNNTELGCCSPLVMSRLIDAISYAKTHGNVDESRIFIVGASGGGYVGLCALMDGRINAASYNLWVPISDLEAWHRLHKDDNYGADIRACTASGAHLNVAEARARSPLYMSAPSSVAQSRVKIYTGLKDGWYGSVPVWQSVVMFNRLAVEAGQAASIVDDATMVRLFNLDIEDGDEEMHGGRKVMLRRSAGDITLTVFDGRHEGLSEQVMHDLRSYLVSSKGVTQTE